MGRAGEDGVAGIQALQLIRIPGSTSASGFSGSNSRASPSPEGLEQQTGTIILEQQDRRRNQLVQVRQTTLHDLRAQADAACGTIKLWGSSRPLSSGSPAVTANSDAGSPC